MPNGHGLGLNIIENKPARPRLRSLNMQTVQSVNKKLYIYQPYRQRYDQGKEGTCVGFGYSWMMSIVNKKFYDAPWLYNEAKKIDPFASENYDGTTSYAGADVLMQRGHRRVWAGSAYLPSLNDGIESVHWTNSGNCVDEFRTCISADVPFGLGVRWYSNFDEPKWDEKRGWVIGEGNLGRVRGGHFICGFAALDDQEMFGLVNTWGFDYPLVKIPYKTVERLIDEDGDGAVIVDRTSTELLASVRNTDDFSTYA